jgi:putative transposase
LLRDRDAKFSRAFDDVVRDEGAEVLVTPVRAPRANAYAERWVRTVRAECLDCLLIVGRGHLEAPDPPAGLTVVGEERQDQVHRHDKLGGLLHEYRRAA